MWGMALKVVREEGGIRGLYRGIVATSMGVAPYVGINFAAYEALRGIITPPGKSNVVRKLTCGALAGRFQSTQISQRTLIGISKAQYHKP
jgi:solute carrier family 25 (mitochondrial phosphate transporter), member 23/24/25/41